MKFDKNKVFSAINAEEAKKYIGKQGWFSNSLKTLKEFLSDPTTLELSHIYDDDVLYRFVTKPSDFSYAFFYPYEPEPELEPELVPIDWEHRHLILGKQIRDKPTGFEYLVTAIEFIDDTIEDVNDKQIVIIVNNKSMSSEFLYQHCEFLDGSVIGMEI